MNTPALLSGVIQTPLDCYPAFFLSFVSLLLVLVSLLLLVSIAVMRLSLATNWGDTLLEIDQSGKMRAIRDAFFNSDLSLSIFLSLRFISSYYCRHSSSLIISNHLTREILFSYAISVVSHMNEKETHQDNHRESFECLSRQRLISRIAY